MNPWESLATGALLPTPRKSSDARIQSAQRSRQRKQMAAHGVSTVAELKEKQALKDNTKHKGFNQPVGKGFIYGNLGHKGSDE